MPYICIDRHQNYIMIANYISRWMVIGNLRGKCSNLHEIIHFEGCDELTEHVEASPAPTGALHVLVPQRVGESSSFGN